MQAKNTPNNGSKTFRTQISHVPKGLSHSAKQRLRWMEHLGKYRNARLTCRHFGLSPDTLYLWKKRFNPDNPDTLEDHFATRRPHKVRISKHKAMRFETIQLLKKLDPRLGKTRIAKILKETGYKISSSTVARMLKPKGGLTLESKEP